MKMIQHNTAVGRGCRGRAVRLNVKLDADGTFAVFFGSKELCGDVANRLDVTEAWNFLMRVYRPGGSVLEGNYKLPKAVEVK
jgi:hypothetical protein